jgi:hypothetical protein
MGVLEQLRCDALLRGQLNARLVGEDFEGFAEIDVFNLHDERKHVAAWTA